MYLTGDLRPSASRGIKIGVPRADSQEWPTAVCSNSDIHHRAIYVIAISKPARKPGGTRRSGPQPVCLVTWNAPPTPLSESIRR